MTDNSKGAVTAATGWQVTSQVETSQIEPGVGVTRGVTVYFRTADGNNSSVFVPQSAYSADNVRALIAAKATQVDTVGRLTSES